MRVVVTHERSDDFLYEGLEIVIDGTYNFNVYNNHYTPEDNNLERNFSDCFDIPDMLRKAYEAGKNGEKLEIVYSDEWE